MCFLFSLIPATFWATVGFFVLFTAARTENGLRLFGRILAIWIFVVALFFPICGAYMSISGLCPFDQLINLFKAVAHV